MIFISLLYFEQSNRVCKKFQLIKFWTVSQKFKFFKKSVVLTVKKYKT